MRCKYCGDEIYVDKRQTCYPALLVTCIECYEELTFGKIPKLDSAGCGVTTGNKAVVADIQYHGDYQGS